ncbi:hypothetical protein FHU41_000251 [Psychromicrobium silvestre]|uniref:Uncharacterized protein n=1 Tax=Psychromicrobium silvestre TaxID=1645614 RepID=A0A7Y9LR28_9MICC|nr:hypothetical protein [Psychromicrobium silvestre]
MKRGLHGAAMILFNRKEHGETSANFDVVAITT